MRKSLKFKYYSNFVDVPIFTSTCYNFFGWNMKILYSDITLTIPYGAHIAREPLLSRPI